VRRNPCLFVVGCARSGTTLLQRMLDAHPQLAVSNDPHFIHEGLRKSGGRDVPLTPELVERVLACPTLRRLGLSDDEVRRASAGARTYGNFVGAIYTTFASKRGKQLAGEKTARYVRYLPLLGAIFPWAKTLHIIRDGRDVALSTLDWARADRGPGRYRLWEEQPIAVCALSWRWHVTTGQRDGAARGPLLHREARYEDLVADPERTMRRIALFLELPFSPEMVTYHRGRAGDASGSTSKDRWLPPTAGLRDWRRQMAPRDVELFEAIAGDALAALGYEVVNERISPEIARDAARCRQRWEAEVRAQRPRKATRLDFGLRPREYAGLA
jgi:Sulfotransferase family